MSERDSKPAVFRIGDFVLDGVRFELRHGAERIAVQPKVLELLLYLAAEHERPISNQELLRVLWPNERVRGTPN